ncbi:MAG: UDP-glucose/GDP-mannose dehydrogenase family protein [Patescibacteria group bacterium]|nr:UDP-glucose/GDP-mannose dehydrogenase family protein [Patescibacteria group bacterium]
MKVAIIGTGYVGLVSGACLADLGHEVVCIDTDAEKISKLENGVMPIYEPGLEELVKRNYQAGRLKFTTSFSVGVPGAEVISIAVGTPSAPDGSVDMSYVDAAARMIGEHLSGYAVIADKSTVPVGTSERVAELMRQVTDTDFDVVSNPEFLREGHAVFDFLKPARIVIGTGSERAADVMRRLYAHIDCPKIVMDERSAELTKYASNAFLATKISFINEVAHLCEAVGADVDAVATGMGSDPRIGKEFLKAGPGWGGSCFPKDVKAFLKLGEEKGHPMPVVNAALAMNKLARSRVVSRLETELGDLRGKKIGIFGVAFKGNTDDTRESPAIDIIRHCVERGADVTVYDPEARVVLSSHGFDVPHAASIFEAAEGALAIVIATEWEEFRTLDLERLKQSMAGNLIMDARNLLDQAAAEGCGFRYLRIGRG